MCLLAHQTSKTKLPDRRKRMRKTYLCNIQDVVWVPNSLYNRRLNEVDPIGHVQHHGPANRHDQRQAQPPALPPVLGLLRVHELGILGSVVGLYSRELFRRVGGPTADEDICEREGHDGGDGKGEEGEE